jgi:hypothetical protein
MTPFGNGFAFLNAAGIAKEIPLFGRSRATQTI